MKPKPSSYVDALTERIAARFETTSHHLSQTMLRRIVRQEVQGVLHEIQHRIYQDAIANLDDLCINIDPKGRRPLCHDKDGQ